MSAKGGKRALGVAVATTVSEATPSCWPSVDLSRAAHELPLGTAATTVTIASDARWEGRCGWRRCRCSGRSRWTLSKVALRVTAAPRLGRRSCGRCGRSRRRTRGEMALRITAAPRTGRRRCGRCVRGRLARGGRRHLGAGLAWLGGRLVARRSATGAQDEQGRDKQVSHRSSSLTAGESRPSAAGQGLLRKVNARRG